MKNQTIPLTEHHLQSSSLYPSFFSALFLQKHSLYLLSSLCQIFHFFLKLLNLASVSPMKLSWSGQHQPSYIQHASQMIFDSGDFELLALISISTHFYSSLNELTERETIVSIFVFFAWSPNATALKTLSFLLFISSTLRASVYHLSDHRLMDVWVNSGRWWWTGRPGVLQFLGSQRVGHSWATELNWTELLGFQFIICLIMAPKLDSLAQTFLFSPRSTFLLLYLNSTSKICLIFF